MKVRGLICCAESVRGFLDGRKTQTRRVMKPQPTPGTLHPECNAWVRDHGNGNWGILWCTPRGDGGILKHRDAHSPFTAPYQVGDVLYVREAWCVGAWDENAGSIAVDYKADGFARKDMIRIEDEEAFQRLWVQSTDDAMAAGFPHDRDGNYHWKRGQGPTRWRSPYHMFKCTARIWLEVTGVRVERVQDISSEDCMAEGIDPEDSRFTDYDMARGAGLTPEESSPERHIYHDWWDELHGKGAWERNDWVFVYDLKGREKPEEK